MAELQFLFLDKSVRFRTVGVHNWANARWCRQHEHVEFYHWSSFAAGTLFSEGTDLYAIAGGFLTVVVRG